MIFPWGVSSLSVKSPLPVYAPWSRVWHRHPSELAIVVFDPVGEGVLRPVEGREDPHVLVIRPALGRDHQRIDAVRLSDRAWLAPWEPTVPPQAWEVPPTLSQYRRQCDRGARRCESLVMLAELDGRVCGVVSMNNVLLGALYGGVLGYWVTSAVAGRGLGSYMVATVIDLLIGEIGVHRVEINVRPENAASLGLVRKLGLREEGMRRRYLHINGKWADHVQFAIDSEDFPSDGCVSFLLDKNRED